MESDKSSPDYKEDEEIIDASKQNSRMTDWDNKGAIPKTSGNDISVSMFKERVKPLHEDTGSSLIQDAWDTLCIKDVYSGTEIDVSSEIDPCLVQRCFEIDHERQTFYNRIKRNVNYIKIKACRVIEIDLKDKTKDIKKVVKNAFSSFISVEEKLENCEELEEIMKKIETLSLVTGKVIGVYREHSRDTVVLHIIGIQGDVNDAQIEIAEIKKQYNIERNKTELCYGDQYDKEQIQFLKRLQFNILLEEMNVDVDFSISKTCHVTLKANDKQSLDIAKSALRAFLENVKFQDIKLPRGARRLILHPCRKAYEYVNEQLQKENIKAFIVVKDGQLAGMQEVQVCGLGDDNTVNAVHTVNNCFVGKPAAGNVTERLHAFLKTHEGSIIMVNESDDIIHLCYTANLQDEVNTLIETSSQNITTVSLECKPFIETFLKRYGKSYVEDLEEKLNVRVSFNNGKCYLNGNVKDLETFREKLKKRFPRKSVFLYTKKGAGIFIEPAECQHKLNDIAQTNKCCWGTEYDTDDDNEKSMCDDGICTRWSFGEFSRTIALVLDYKVGTPDMLVYPVNANMFVEYAWDIHKTGGKELHTACRAGLKKKEDIGKVKIISEGLKRIQCNAVATVVICDTETHNATQLKRFISYHKLKQSVKTILSEATNRRLKSVVFPLPNINYDYGFTPAFFTEAVVNGMIDFYETHKSSCLTHIYLSGKQSVMDSAFNSAENHLKSQPSVRRQMSCLDQVSGLFNKSKQLHLEVQVKSIFDVKAECIVVTVSRTLDLKKGLLSRLLLEKATEDIQDKLSLKHQLNLREGETVVISTKITGNKRVRTVILGYISKWKKDKRPNILLTFVKECCFAAQKEGCSSIAFPALGTGSLEYPQREAAKMIFNGIQQYNKETMSGNIKQIFITLMKKGDHVYSAFQNEQRRISVYKGLKPRLVKPFGYPQLVRDTSPKIKVLEKSNLPTTMPSRFIEVDVNVNSKETSSPIQIQRSSDEMNDRIEVECIDQYRSFEYSIKRVLEKSEEDRATAILFHCTHYLSFSAFDQVYAIVDSIMKAKNIIYLSDVVISTEDIADFDCVQNALCNNNVYQQSASSLLMSFFLTKTRPQWSVVREKSSKEPKKPQWSLVRSESSVVKPVVIQMIGVDKETLDTASAEIEDLLKSRDTLDSTDAHNGSYDGLTYEKEPSLNKTFEILDDTTTSDSPYSIRTVSERNNRGHANNDDITASSENETVDSDMLGSIRTKSAVNNLASVSSASLPSKTVDSEMLGSIRTTSVVNDKSDSSAFSQDDEIADSDILGSITTTNPVVDVASGSDMLGSIKATKLDLWSANASEMLGSITTTKPTVQSATGSDMLGSIIKKPIGQSATGSEMLGSITTHINAQITSDSSDEEEEIQLGTFDIIIRCKKRKGGYSTLVLKARTTEEALKWRYIFSNNQQHRVTQKLEQVCQLNHLRMSSNVAEIECENIKLLAFEESIKRIITQETIDLRVTDFSIETEECQRVVDVLTRNCPAFSDQTVSLFMESARCYLVSPAHVFEANIEVYQQTRDFLSTTLGSQPTKRKN